MCLKFVEKSVKNHSDLYPLKNVVRETRLGCKKPLAVPKFKTQLHQLSGKVYLSNLYNDNLGEGQIRGLPIIKDTVLIRPLHKLYRITELQNWSFCLQTWITELVNILPICGENVTML